MNDKKLRLNIRGLISHYLIGALYLIGGAAFISKRIFYDFEANSEEWQKPNLLWAGSAFIFLGLWVCYRQNKRLNFDIITLENLSKEEVFEIAKKIFLNHQWQIIKENDNSLEAEGGSFRGSFMDYLENRKRFTIIYEPDQLLVNCIVAPPKSASIFTFGKLRKNIDDFTDLFVEEVYTREKGRTPAPNVLGYSA
jgi:hypothetical protein